MPDLNTYVQRVQNLTASDDLATAVAEQLDGENESAAYKSFLSGEEAFLRGEFKTALMHYLSAREIPNFHFFCYRASACVANQLNRNSKAMGFARKALRVCPNDRTCLQLLSELLPEHEAAPYMQRLDGLNNSIEPAPVPETEEITVVGLGEEELNELSTLFNEEPEETSAMEEQTLTSVEEAPTMASSAPTNSSADALQELKALAESTYGAEDNSTSRFMSDNLGVDLESEQSLESQIRAFQRAQVDAMSRYVEQGLQLRGQMENTLTVLHGWRETGNTKLNHMLLPASYRSATGGYFLRWNGKGIAINPGENFLQNFHDQGHHIKEIDTIIVTRDDPSSYADIKAIYDLNYGLNRIASDLHIIRYYLNQNAHRSMATTLKPHFKQERNTVFSLDLYVDSPEVESLALSEGVTLNYFPTPAQESAIGIRLDLELSDVLRSGTEGKKSMAVSYLSGAPYSPILAHHLTGTDILIAGLGSTSEEDYGKSKYSDSSLGFYGTASVLEDVTPQLLIFSELSGKQGDVRMELTRKLRQESTGSTSILPADTGLKIDLESLRVHCSISGTPSDLSEVRVAKTDDNFGRLQYLSARTLI